MEFSTSIHHIKPIIRSCVYCSITIGTIGNIIDDIIGDVSGDIIGDMSCDIMAIPGSKYGYC